MKGVIETIKVEDKRVGLKIGGTWYGAWLKDKNGNDTEFQWLKRLAKGNEIEFEQKPSEDGKYHNITKAAPILPGAGTDTGKPGATRDSATNNSIERQVCLKVAGEIVVALVEAKALGGTDVAGEALTKLFDYAVRAYYGDQN